jgi:transcriptional regulator with XRE-family HTH domain
MTFGEWLRAERERRGWSQQYLADQVGVTQQAIYLLERGKRPNPGGKVLAGLARAFGTTIDDLLRHTDATPVLDQLRAEGIPADVLARLQEIYPDLTAEDLELAIEIARMARPKRARQPQQRPGTAGGATGGPGEPDQAPGSSGRISAAGRRMRRLEV